LLFLKILLGRATRADLFQDSPRDPGPFVLEAIGAGKTVRGSYFFIERNVEIPIVEGVSSVPVVDRRRPNAR